MDIIPAEIIGTALLILLGDGVVAAVLLARSKAENSGWIVITFGWGFAVMVGAYAVGQFSGAHLNPAVTVGLWINGNIDFGEAIQYFIRRVRRSHDRRRARAGDATGSTSSRPRTRVSSSRCSPRGRPSATRSGTWSPRSSARSCWCSASSPSPWTRATPAPAESGLSTLLVAFLVVGIGLSLGGPTGYAINPARDLGPRIIHAVLPVPGKGDSDWGYAWIPVVGPLIGGALGALLYVVAWPG